MTLKEFFNSKKPIKLGNPLAPMGDFPLINASDVIVGYDDVEKKEIRLDEKLESIGNSSLTPADKSEIIAEVLNSLPIAEEVSV